MMRYISTSNSLFGVQTSNTYYFESYCSSDLGKSLNTTFYNDQNFPDKNILVKGVTWYKDSNAGFDSGKCTVGLLSKFDYESVVLEGGKYSSTRDNVDSWINDDDDIGWLVTRNAWSSQYYVKCYFASVGRVTCNAEHSTYKNEYHPVHPVVELNTNVTIASGKGTKSDPYIFNTTQ